MVEIKFAAGASLQSLLTILPLSLVNRMNKRCYNIRILPDDGRTRTDIFVERALEHYLKFLDKEESNEGKDNEQDNNGGE